MNLRIFYTRGACFLSETDTEVIAQLVYFYHQKGLNLEEAVIKGKASSAKSLGICKAFTTQIALLYLLALYLASILNKIDLAPSRNRERL